MSDLFNILSHSNKDIDNQKLMDYLSGKLSAEENHEVERWISENEFSSDALEGLQSVSEPAQLPALVEQLNRGLKKSLSDRKNRREKKRIRNNPWTYLTLLIILALAVLAYIVIRKITE